MMNNPSSLYPNNNNIKRKIELKVFPSLEKLSSYAADIFSELLNSEGENCFIVPGGKTPLLFYKYLADKVIDWTGVTLIPSDERLVEEASSKSNMGMIRKNLIKRIEKKNKPILVSLLNRDNQSNSDQVISSLKAKLRQFMPPKAAFLGIGEDGHTASIFSGCEEKVFNSEILFYTKRDLDPFRRISLSASFLASTPRLIFFVNGKRKRPVIKEIFNNKKSINHLPVMRVIKQAEGRVTVICDKMAAPND